MKKTLLSLFIGLVLFSCSDRTQINLVSGKIFERCEVPIANQEIALKASTGDPIIIGSAISGKDGTYIFTYELEEDRSGTGEFILIDTQGFVTVVRGVELNEDVVYDHYNEDDITVNVILEGNRNYSTTDTLFFGYTGSGKELSVVQPSNGELANISSTLANEFGNKGSRRIYYGIGKVNFDIAKKDAAERNIDLNITPCSLTDTARIIIN